MSFKRIEVYSLPYTKAPGINELPLRKSCSPHETQDGVAASNYIC